MQSTATHRSGLSSGRRARRDLHNKLELDSTAWIGGRSKNSSMCSLEPLLASIQYKNGSIFRGSISRSKSKRSTGRFQWISGLQYMGQFRDDQREGEGELTWPDGSRYVGEFHCDIREGKGKHFWKDSGEVYVGEYHNDKRHGNGVYSWSSGASFRGTFREDLKEGPGIYISAQGEKFEGMYHGDIRDGEGILTYPSKVKDKGIWKGMKLMQLKFAIPGFHFDPYSSDPLESPEFSAKKKRRGPKGYLEVASQEFIQHAFNNNLTKVKSILEAGAIHVDVTDANKCSALFAAAINSHCDVVDYLLDNGADVNQLESHGVSVLNACHHILYSSHSEVKALLNRHHLVTEQTHSSTTLNSGEIEAHITPDMLDSDYIQEDQGMEDYDLYRSISLGPCLYDQDRLCVDGSSVVALDGDGIQAELHKANSLPYLPSHQQGQDKRVHFRPNTYDVDLSLLTSVTEKKPTDTDSGTIIHNGSKEGVTADCEPSPPVILKIPESSQHSTKADTDKDPRIGHGSMTDQTVLDIHSATASANGEILGVSALNTEDGSTLSVKQNGEGYDENELSMDVAESSDISNAPADSSSSEKHESLKGNETPLPTYTIQDMDSDYHAIDSEVDTMTSNPDVEKSIDQDTHRLPSLRKQQPRLSLGLDNMPGSSAFSSSNFGSIISAAQSMTITYAESDHSLAESDQTSVDEFSVTSSTKHTVSSTQDVVVTIRCVRKEKMREIIQLLLSRGANPNTSSNPVHPLVYTILTGDIVIAGMLLQHGANPNHVLPEEFGGYSLLHLATKKVISCTPSMVEILLQYKADPNSNFGGLGRGTKDSNTITPEREEVEFTRKELVGGENEGIGTLTPLHFICGVRITETGEVKDTLKGLIPLVIHLLVYHGADVNAVSNGHSPLSLAILSGHDNAVEALLEKGADPNIPLGLGVANAMCALTTHAAHKVRFSSSSIALSSGLFTFSCPLLVLDKLMMCGASILSPVKLAKGDIGIVTDFAHAAFKEDKRLSLLKYSSLSKAERTRYRSVKKLHKHLVNLLRCKALHRLASDDEFWNQVTAVQAHVDVMNDVVARLHTSHMPFRSPERRTAVSLKKTEAAPSMIILPEITLTASLNNVVKVLREGYVEEMEEEEEEEDRGEPNKPGAKPKKKAKPNKIVRYKELIEKAATIFENYREADDGTQNKSWGFPSFCYECGRSVGVRLTLCPGCEVVCYCSRNCKGESWKRGHREECSKADVIRLRMLSTYSQSGRTSRQQKSRPNTESNLI